MDRSAVFVDAGYLFAAGSAALAGSKQPRHLLAINEKVAIQTLAAFAVEKTNFELLRIYWYDGITAKGQTSDHQRLAACDHVKLRLGFINSSGQQKGVDSLIVTDLVELARNGAMRDAILVAGDEDTRIGVQIAQSYGVRVHLLGVAPSRSNQSKPLLHEADTTSEWDRNVVASFLTIIPGLSAPLIASVSPSPIQGIPQTTPVSIPDPEAVLPTVEKCVCEFMVTLKEEDIAAIYECWINRSQIPAIFDRRLLAHTRDRLSRRLVGSERISMRNALIEAIRKGQEGPRGSEDTAQSLSL